MSLITQIFCQLFIASFPGKLQGRLSRLRWILVNAFFFHLLVEIYQIHRFPFRVDALTVVIIDVWLHRCYRCLIALCFRFQVNTTVCQGVRHFAPDKVQIIIVFFLLYVYNTILHFIYAFINMPYTSQQQVLILDISKNVSPSASPFELSSFTTTILSSTYMHFPYTKLSNG